MGISPYIRRLRERVGHELLLMPAVAVLPWDERGRLLLVGEAQTGLWQTIGGSVEPDEAPLEAAVELLAAAGVSARQPGKLREDAGGDATRAGGAP